MRRFILAGNSVIDDPDDLDDEIWNTVIRVWPSLHVPMSHEISLEQIRICLILVRVIIGRNRSLSNTYVSLQSKDVRFFQGRRVRRHCEMGCLCITRVRPTARGCMRGDLVMVKRGISGRCPV